MTTTPLITKGQKIRINPNLQEELNKLGFDPGEARAFAARFAGTKQTAHDIWTGDEGQRFVTIDLCCEVPIQCCDPIE